MMDQQGRIIRLALGQYMPRARDLEYGEGRIMTLMEEAAQTGADWLLLPELFLGGYQLSDTLPISLPADSDVLDRVAQCARRLGIGVQVGFIEREGSETYDSVLNITPSGRRTIYRKTHLYGPEHGAYQAGNELPVIAENGLTIAPLICYELEFPEPARLAATRGAKLILVSTANPEPFSEQQILFARTRALENRAFVAVCNRVGAESGFTFGGSSLIAGPSGQVIVQAGRAEEVMLVGDCDLGLIAQAEADGDYLADRRADIYREPMPVATRR
jgi:predicted amidohydrolase